MNIKVKIKKIEKDFPNDFVAPNYATSGSAGMDLYACIKEPITMKPNEVKRVPTGVAIHIGDNNVGGFIFPRSGLATKHGITLINSVGVIDSDYTGELICAMVNLSQEDYIINPGDRIAQIVFLPVISTEFIVTGVLENTIRGSGGFGSTGK